MKRRIICNHKFEIANRTIWEASIAEIGIDMNKQTISGCCNNEKGDILFIINYRTKTAIIMIEPDETMRLDIENCNYGLSNGGNGPYKNCNNWEDVINFIKETNNKKSVMVRNEIVTYKELELLEIEDVHLYGNVKINIETGEVMVIYSKTEKDLDIGKEWIFVNNYKTRPGFIKFMDDIVNALRNCGKAYCARICTRITYNV